MTHKFKPMVASVLLVCLCLATTAQAAYVSREDSHDMGNGAVGKVNIGMDDSYCTASSWATAKMTYCEVSVSFIYGWGTDKFTVTGHGIGTSRPVSVNVPPKHYNAKALSAQSDHVVTANAVTWETSLAVRS